MKLRTAILVIVLLVKAQRGSSQAKQTETENDDWHPKHRFSKTQQVLSSLFLDAVRSAEHLSALGQHNEALDICNSVLYHEPKHAPSLTAKAMVLNGQGMASAARKSAQDAIDADPGWIGAYHFLASLYRVKGHNHIQHDENEAAYESFRKILLLDLDGEVLTSTDMASAYYGMGRALHGAGVQTEAIANLRRAVSICPRCTEMQHVLARWLIERDEQSGASISDGAPTEVYEQETLRTLRDALDLLHDQYLWIHLLAANQRALEWTGHHYHDMQSLTKQLAQEISHSHCSLSPHLLLSFPIASEIVLLCSRAIATSAIRHAPPRVNGALERMGEHNPKCSQRLLRVAYLSGQGFSSAHPTSYLLQDLVQLHNKSLVHIVCLDMSQYLRPQDEPHTEGEGGVKHEAMETIQFHSNCGEYRHLGREIEEMDMEGSSEGENGGGYRGGRGVSRVGRLAAILDQIQPHLILDLSGHSSRTVMQVIASSSTTAEFFLPSSLSSAPSTPASASPSLRDAHLAAPEAGATGSGGGARGGGGAVGGSGDAGGAAGEAGVLEEWHRDEPVQRVEISVMGHLGSLGSDPQVAYCLLFILLFFFQSFFKRTSFLMPLHRH